MKYYKISLLLIFFMILSIGAISAETLDDAQADGDLLLDSSSAIAIDSQEENTITNENNEEPLGEGEPKNFTQLKSDVDFGSHDWINLDSDYTYDESDGDIDIIISNERTSSYIEGNNHTIDAQNKTGIFKINGCKNLIIRNLIIKNAARSAFIMYGGASLTTINVTFENNHDSESGAAVYVSGDSKYSSYNDTFKNNHAKLGSDIFVYDSEANIKNSTFVNDEIEWALIYGTHGDIGTVINIEDCEFWNMSSKYATVVYNSYQTTIKGSKFINLKSISGGAIGVKGLISEDGYIPFLNISDSQFINVSSSKNGGAILADMNGASDFEDGTYYGELILNKTLFDNCKSSFGGAIAQFGGKAYIYNSNFTNNNADYIGGAIYASNASVYILGSVFENNTAEKNTFFETGGENNSFRDRYGNFSSGAIYIDTGYFYIGFTDFTNNAGAISLFNTLYDIKNGNKFNENGIAIKSYFNNKNSTIGNITLNNDTISLDNEIYDLNIDEKGAEIPLDIYIINNASADSERFDLRDYGLVSDVRNQGQMGDCWAFGTAGALESAILKATNKNIVLDISENNMKGILLAYFPIWK